MNTFGSYLKILTYNNGIRATQMASSTGLSPAVFSKYFQSKSVPDKETCEKIINFLSPLISVEEEAKLLELWTKALTGTEIGPVNESDLESIEQVLIRKFRDLTKEQKAKIIHEIDNMRINNLDKMAENAGL